MAANASRQTTEHTGGDSAVSSSDRSSDQKQTGSQEQKGAQSTQRSSEEGRNADALRIEDTTSARKGSATSASTRDQTTEGSTHQNQSSKDVTVTERPRTIRRTTQSGGGQNSVLREDIAMTVSFELEILSPLAK